MLLKNGTRSPRHQGATCFPCLCVCVCVDVHFGYRETALLLRATPRPPGGINESRITCVCASPVYVCVSKSASFRAPRNRCAYSRMHYSDGVCSRYAWVECCKRLKLRWKWRPGKKMFFPLTAVCQVSDLLLCVIIFFFLSPDKCGDYPLTCIPFTSLCKATPPLQGNESDGFLAVDSDLYLSLCVTVYDSCFTAFCFILFLSLDRKRRRVYIGESLKMTGRNVSVTQLAAVSGFVFHRRRNWSKMSCQMAYIRATLCVHISYLIKIKLSEMSFDRY